MTNLLSLLSNHSFIINSNRNYKHEKSVNRNLFQPHTGANKKSVVLVPVSRRPRRAPPAPPFYIILPYDFSFRVEFRRGATSRGTWHKIVNFGL